MPLGMVGCVGVGCVGVGCVVTIWMWFGGVEGDFGVIDTTCYLSVKFRVMRKNAVFRRFDAVLTPFDAALEAMATGSLMTIGSASMTILYSVFVIDPHIDDVLIFRQVERKETV